MGALFGFTGRRDTALLRQMSATLRNRGRGAERMHETDVLSLGVREQEAHSPAADLYHHNGVAVACSGRVEGFSTSDTAEQICNAYLEQGLDFLKQACGAFVIAIKDHDVVHVVRDGPGIRTVYFARQGKRFLFAIEPKGILACSDFERRLRPAAVAQYLAYSFIPGSGTMLEDLYELPAGHVVTLAEDREPEVRRYFVFENGVGGEEDSDWVSRFRNAFGDAVARKLPSGETVGVFLSGGLDSSVVTAEVAKRHDAPVKTFAIHFGKHYQNELEFARSVAERCGTEHEEVLIRPKGFLPRLRKIIWHLDEPIGDPITVPNFELAAHVSQDVRTIFNGEGGDPLFGGPKNIPMMLHHWYGGVERSENFREKLYLASYRRAYDDLNNLLAPDLQAKIDEKQDLEGLLTPYFTTEDEPNFLNKLMAINTRLKGAHLILPKVERMTSAWGLTAHAPLFDEELMKLSFQMPTQLKLSRGVEKVVIKRAYEDDLPEEIIARPKSGMRVPVHYWFKGEMKRYAKHVLSPKNVRRAGIFNEKRVKQLLDYDIEGVQARYGLRLWMLLTFEIWRRIVIEREAI